jgi:hypothetical protein
MNFAIHEGNRTKYKHIDMQLPLLAPCHSCEAGLDGDREGQPGDGWPRIAPRFPDRSSMLFRFGNSILFEI